MCGRYILKVSIEDLIERYAINKNSVNIKTVPDAEIFPGKQVPVVIASNKKRNLKQFKWGFNFSFLPRPVINARGESLGEKKLFRRSFICRRCIIPATAFFEWKKLNKKNIKHQIFSPEERIISLAGIFDSFNSSSGDKLKCFTIITVSSSRQLQNIHHRMPLVLGKEEEEYWLDNSLEQQELEKLIKSYSGILKIKPLNEQSKLNFDN
ncbi:MAG TPA: SOS response-associated peptidase [Halanaerobiales bacterium]|nr:SOS response-associated peptidase [Halanaerobiales bacterium]